VPARVIVDASVCSATGYCERVAPELFQRSVRGDGLAEARKDTLTTPAELFRALEAESMCPTGAISVLAELS
jgi:ferredoxin